MEQQQTASGEASGSRLTAHKATVKGTGGAAAWSGGVERRRGAAAWSGAERSDAPLPSPRRAIKQEYDHDWRPDGFNNV
ncbi:hypothetical protein EYF80_056927 [Liparis tanakae]|uniref:Uncharacterized protein n=1 Tax=Liparis tanakae TaxID=230148 RepID=A0A4Z2EVS7_9TELE|nr:hypothetical protein EYF80_056927 [Liparis tanakae]